MGALDLVNDIIRIKSVAGQKPRHITLSPKVYRQFLEAIPPIQRLSSQDEQMPNLIWDGVIVSHV